jgi:hypothetical protein
MGRAIMVGGFFAMEVDPLPVQQEWSSLTAIIRFKSSPPLSVAQLSDELKELVDDQWDWLACKLSESEFLVVFPSQATLRMGTRSGRLFLPIHKVEVEIREAFLEP